MEGAFILKIMPAQIKSRQNSLKLDPQPSYLDPGWLKVEGENSIMCQHQEIWSVSDGEETFPLMRDYLVLNPL